MATTAQKNQNQHLHVNMDEGSVRFLSEFSLLESSISLMLKIPHDYVHPTAFEELQEGSYGKIDYRARESSEALVPMCNSQLLDPYSQYPLAQTLLYPGEPLHDGPLIRTLSETTVGTPRCSSQNRFTIEGGQYSQQSMSFMIDAVNVDADRTGQLYSTGITIIEQFPEQQGLNQFRLEKLSTLHINSKDDDTSAAASTLMTGLIPALPSSVVSTSGSTKKFRKARSSSRNGVKSKSRKSKERAAKPSKQAHELYSREITPLKPKRRPPMVKQYYFTQICNCLYELLVPVSYKLICDYVYKRLPAPPSGFSQISRESMESSVRKTVSMYTQQYSTTHKQVFAVVNQENGFVIMFHPEADASSHYKAYLKRWDRGH
ncbi:hypothetical protein SARC_03534 [Sphaeroforma arctica JP610]|uniref:Uncharacterized protein n=1 Tax=Sphaeroforma arctica JP610 TaxID=667725 RepID=A0A0L0G7N1_9EUKA|nr:hypothetical protein SARC_03534 [Sphaeroforma arctica JP610]KNC84233.1 hypothetical protein SARC_03534 [Sphaeroforma arctica JP610]|eukprot:XP_014158135.1 hypothetical protein SARC_03534 [Sphaeroforma arctica JP610]